MTLYRAYQNIKKLHFVAATVFYDRTAYFGAQYIFPCAELGSVLNRKFWKFFNPSYVRKVLGPAKQEKVTVCTLYWASTTLSF